MSDNTAASTTPATTIGTALGHAISELRACSCPECSSEVAILRNTRDSLDALREAVKPLEKWAADFDKWAATASRDPAPSRILPDMRHLLDACNRLLGSEIEGDQ